LDHYSQWKRCYFPLNEASKPEAKRVNFLNNNPTSGSNNIINSTAKENFTMNSAKKLTIKQNFQKLIYKFQQHPIAAQQHNISQLHVSFKEYIHASVISINSTTHDNDRH